MKRKTLGFAFLLFGNILAVPDAFFFYPAIISTGGFSGRLSTSYTPADSTVLVSSPYSAVIYFPRRQRFPSFIPAALVRSMQHGTSIL